MNKVGVEMNKPVLVIEDLTVSFDGFKAVSDLNFYLDKNEVHVVIGPNGAGKTTVLDLICGKTKATSGTIKFNDIELTKLKEFDIVRKGVGRKFQNPNIYENLSVYDNLEMSFPRGRNVFGALFFRRTKDVDARIREVAGKIFLTDLLDTSAGLLSHGQKQWLEIGMLLMQRPKLILLDEPVAGMTDAETERTAELCLELKKNHTLIVVEHDMSFIDTISEKVTVLAQGAILAEGTLAEVQANDDVIEKYLGR